MFFRRGNIHKGIIFIKNWKHCLRAFLYHLFNCQTLINLCFLSFLMIFWWSYHFDTLIVKAWREIWKAGENKRGDDMQQKENATEAPWYLCFLLRSRMLWAGWESSPAVQLTLRNSWTRQLPPLQKRERSKSCGNPHLYPWQWSLR